MYNQGITNHEKISKNSLKLINITINMYQNRKKNSPFLTIFRLILTVLPRHFKIRIFPKALYHNNQQLKLSQICSTGEITPSKNSNKYSPLGAGISVFIFFDNLEENGFLRSLSFFHFNNICWSNPCIRIYYSTHMKLESAQSISLVAKKTPFDTHLGH